MKKYIKQITTVCIIVVLYLGTGCTDKFNEINTDPDNPTEVPTINLLSWSIWYTSANFYDRWFMLDEPCSFAAYVAKLSFIDEAKYQFRTGVQDSNWAEIYRALVNLRDIQQRAQEENRPNLVYAAKIMEVKVMQIATDRWRDLPYSNAVSMRDGVLLPTYDKQEDIYPALLALLKEVADQMADAPASDDISGGDLLFQGDMSKWRKFCNSLRLRLAIRISEVSPELAKITVEEVLGDPARYPLMVDNNDNAFFWWDPDDSNRYEPIADAYRTRKSEFCAPDVMVNYMNQNNDPRLSVYFTPTPSSQMEGDPDYNDGIPLYRGYIIGAAEQPPAKNYSVWAYKYGQDLGGMSPYMRVAEVYFHIAEAAMLGYNTGGITAEDAYMRAVNFSMLENEVSSEDAAAYMAGVGLFTGQLRQIWYEEWVAMFKQGMEGWSLYRRTGVPENNYIAPGRPAQYADHNVPPFRSPYPDTERDLNSSNNQPFNAEVVDNLWGKQMWWDTRTDVH